MVHQTVPFLSSNHIPGRFTHDPSLICIRGVRFAFLVRRKAEDTIARFQRARPETIGTFHQLDAALQETLCFDPYKVYGKDYFLGQPFGTVKPEIVLICRKVR